jgi:hypothetical protein
VRKADNLTAISEPIVYKMWEPRRLKILWASTVCYRDSLTFSLRYKGASTLLVLVLVLARLVLVGRLVWLLLVLVNLRPHYFSCSLGLGA